MSLVIPKTEVKMRLKSLASLSCAATSGIVAGTLIERRRNGGPAADFKPPSKMPGLPVFGTVSAATPFSGSEGGGSVVPAPASPLKGRFTIVQFYTISIKFSEIWDSVQGGFHL